MTEQLQRYDNILPLSDIEIEEWQKKLDEFNRVLDEPPPQSEIQFNGQSKSHYLPISFVETKLDEIFFGLWEITDFQFQPIANEIVGSLKLRYFHPKAKTWITRIGLGAVQIQFNKGSQISDLNNKIKNTLQKDFPHLKAECLKNACRSIGKKFGRDLNRDLQDSYEPQFLTDDEEKVQSFLEETLLNIREFEIESELKEAGGKILAEANKIGCDSNEISMLKGALNSQFKKIKGK